MYWRFEIGALRGIGKVTFAVWCFGQSCLDRCTCTKSSGNHAPKSELKAPRVEWIFLLVYICLATQLTVATYTAVASSDPNAVNYPGVLPNCHQ